MSSCVWLFVHELCFHLFTPLRHQSSSPSSSRWGRWPICRCPACRQEACSGLQTWQQQILSIFCLWPSLEPCSSSWRWAAFHWTQTYFSKQSQQQKESTGELILTHFTLSWVQSLASTTPTCEPWRPCSGSCLLSSSLSPSASPRSVCHSHASVFFSHHNRKSLKPLLHLYSCLKCIFSPSFKLQAVFTYWLTSNCFSLCQVGLLKHPLIRKKLNIPERITHPPSVMPQNDGFIESIKKGGCCKHKSVDEVIVFRADFKL